VSRIVVLMAIVAGVVLLADLGSPANDVASGQEGPAAEPAVEAVKQVRERGAPVAVLKARTNLRAKPGGRVLAKLDKRTEWRSPRVLAVVGAKGKWLRVIATELPNDRRGWIALKAASLVANPWAVRADLSRRRVVVTRNGRVVYRFRVAVGRPGTPTPRGRFAVTDKLQIAGGSPAYGCCALALSGKQPHIEPGWQGGNRLAIHGTRLTQTIGRAASFGCLRARDKHAYWIIKHVFLGTIVEIRP